MSKVQVSVAIPDASRFQTTVGLAKKAGLKVDQELDILGVATGSIDESALEKLHRVPGVSSVEKERSVSVPSPVAPRE